jgi:phosphohistidine phosphatase
MIIYFVRHASAGQKKLSGKKDEKRPLDPDGVQQCTQMGRVLSSMEVGVDAIISSPLKRATQTAALIANEVGYEGKLHIEDALRPEAKYDHFREMLRDYSKHESIMVVGHNPNFSDFLGRTIAGSGERAHVDIRKGSVAKVESKQKKYVLDWLLTPRLAKAAADANAGESASSSVQNGNGEFEIPDEYLTLRARSLPSDDQEPGRTTKSRPKTSRK